MSYKILTALGAALGLVGTGCASNLVERPSPSQDYSRIVSGLQSDRRFVEDCPTTQIGATYIRLAASLMTGTGKTAERTKQLPNGSLRTTYSAGTFSEADNPGVAKTLCEVADEQGNRDGFTDTNEAQAMLRAAQYASKVKN